MWELILKHILELIGLSVIAASVTVAAWLRSVIKRPSALRRLNEASTVIHQLLTELRVRLNAERAFLVQFRNGDRFSLDTPIFRLFVTYEIVGSGVASATLAWSDLLASQFHEILSPMFEDVASLRPELLPCTECRQSAVCKKRESGSAKLIVVPNMVEGVAKSMLIQQGTSRLAIAPMMDGKHLVGFVVGDFRRSSVNELTHEQCDAICHTARNIMYELQRAAKDSGEDNWFRRWFRKL